MRKKKIPPELQAWADARKRHKLSHAHVQMARELGMNPRKLGGLDNHKQQRWKAPLSVFIEDLYIDRFGRDRPVVVRSVEELARAKSRSKGPRKPAQNVAEPERCSDEGTAEVEKAAIADVRTFDLEI